MTDYAQNPLYKRWLEASAEKTAFWMKNHTAWDDATDATYKALEARSEALYYDYLAEKTGKTPHEIACSINEKMHSARD